MWALTPPKLLVQIKVVVGAEPKGFAPEGQAQEEAGATGADPCPAAWQIGPALPLLVNEVLRAHLCAGNDAWSCTNADLDCSCIEVSHSE